MPRTRKSSWRAFGYPKAMLLLAAVLSVLGLYISPVGAAVTESIDRLNSNNYVLKVLPSAADEAVLSLAYSQLGRIDEENLPLLAGTTESGEVMARSYEDLEAALGTVSVAPVFWYLEDISASLVRSYEEGNLPLSALFAAAKDARVVEGPEEVKGSTTIVEVVDTKNRSQELQEAISEYDQAYQQLDKESAAIAVGTLDVATLSEQRLQEIVAADGELAERAQLQLDMNLAANLPDLSSELNGELSPELLCPIPWEPTELLLCAIMGNFERMNDAYKVEFGTDLPILNGYRTLSEQYYVNAQSPTMTAIPGTSNHGLGQAIDFNWDIFNDWDDPEVVWMINNGPRFGFRLPSALGPTTDRPEPWHYEFGTSYSADNSADFLGPAPQVVYRIISPWNP